MRWPGAAAIIAATVDAFYLAIIASQTGSDPQFLTVPFVAGFIALMAVCAALASIVRADRWRAFLLGVSTGGLLLLGFFALSSIGAVVAIAGLVAAFGLWRTVVRLWRSDAARGRAADGALAAGGFAIAVVMLLASFIVTEVAIKCPPTGSESGGGISVLASSYQYSCDNGRLTLTR